MLGAIIGDVVGSLYEFSNIKTTEFPFFDRRSTYTDDSIMTVAVANWLLKDGTHGIDTLEESMVHYAELERWPFGGYGGTFHLWLFRPECLVDFNTGEKCAKRAPYNSCGNGSAMRVSPVGWFFDTLEETLQVAKISAEITHNHPEGIKGAQATAAAIFLARQGASKDEIRDYVTANFNYDLNRTCDQIRPNYRFDGTCQGTVPEAIIAFLESNDFEHAIRLAVSLGGDSDTLACITGCIAEAYYKNIPSFMVHTIMDILPPYLKEILLQFKERVKCKW